MVTVIFPTGFSVQYNDGNKVQRRAECTDIQDSKGNHIAQAPNNAIVEFVTPCRMYFAGHDDKDALIAKLEKQVRRQRTTIKRLRG